MDNNTMSSRIGEHFIALLSFGPKHVKSKIESNPNYLFSKKVKAKYLISSIVIGLIVSVIVASYFLKLLDDAYILILCVIAYLGLSFNVTYFISLLSKTNILSQKLSEKLIQPVIPHVKVHQICSKDEVENETILGVNLLDKSIIKIPDSRRQQHIITSGMTGSGKSSQVISIRNQDIRKGFPAIDIDPKGSKEDIDAIKYLLKKHNRLEDFIHFDLDNPDSPYKYNVLRHGNIEQKCSKLIRVLDLENPYYRDLAMTLCNVIFNFANIAGITINLNFLEETLLNKSNIKELYSALTKKKCLVPRDVRAKYHLALSYKDEDISGIRAAISLLNNRQTRMLFNVDDSLNQTEIDFFDIITQKKYLYLQLNSSGYGNLNEKICNFIMEDLSLVCNQRQKKRQEELEFVPVYIDEFPLFAKADFSNFQAVCRSAKLGLTLMFQGVANINRIDPYLIETIFQNSAIAIHFKSANVKDRTIMTGESGVTVTRSRTNKVVDSQAGVSIKEEGTSYQEHTPFIDLNLILKLKEGQAVFLNKISNEYAYYQSWHGKAAVSFLKNEEKKVERKETKPIKSSSEYLESLEQELKYSAAFDNIKYLKEKI